MSPSKKKNGTDDDGSNSPRARIGDSSAAGQGRELAVARQYAPVVSGSSNVPTLTSSNYAEWSLLMEVSLQARGLWAAVEGQEDLNDEYGYRNDKGALELIYRSVPVALLPVLRKHKSAQATWDAIRTMRAGSEKLRDAKAQSLRSDYDQLRHKPGESVDDLAMRLTGLTAKLAELGDPESDKKVMQKWLRIVPKRYSQLAHSIDNLVDLNMTSIEEIVGRFKAAEERYEQEAEEEGGTKLYLTEEEWHARAGRHESGSSSGGKKPRGKGQADRGKGATRSGNTGKGAPRRDGNCRYCGIKGHWARECRKKERDEANGVAHVAEAEDDDPTLLMVQVTPSPEELAAEEEGDLVVHLNEERAKVCLGAEDDAKDPKWHMDTGASNHMTSNIAMFSELDRSVTGTIRFSDGSVVGIKGRGTVVFVAHGGRHRVLSRVYYIPRLRTSIVSVGQLDEVGCSALVKGGYMVVQDRQENLIAKVPRTGNRLYTTALQITRPVCLMAAGNSDAWKWHARY
jgi:hypothetical protein